MTLLVGSCTCKIVSEMTYNVSSGTLNSYHTIAEESMQDSSIVRLSPGNYRPISNLTTVSKVLERLVSTRLRPHLLGSVNFSEYQSAYRKGHVNGFKNPYNSTCTCHKDMDEADQLASPSTYKYKYKIQVKFSCLRLYTLKTMSCLRIGTVNPVTTIFSIIEYRPH